LQWRANRYSTIVVVPLSTCQAGAHLRARLLSLLSAQCSGWRPPSICALLIKRLTLSLSFPLSQPIKNDTIRVSLFSHREGGSRQGFRRSHIFREQLCTSQRGNPSPSAASPWSRWGALARSFEPTAWRCTRTTCGRTYTCWQPGHPKDRQAQEST